MICLQFETIRNIEKKIFFIWRISEFFKVSFSFHSQAVLFIFLNAWLRYIGLLCNLTFCVMIIAFIWVSLISTERPDQWQITKTKFLSFKVLFPNKEHNSLYACDSSCLFGNNTIKYVWNARLVLPFLNWDKNETKELIGKNFVLN